MSLINLKKINKNILLTGTIVFVLIASFALVLIQKNSKGGSGDEIYYCPMHPTYTSDRPGDCPICNMKLVKKELESETNKDSSFPRKRESKDADPRFRGDDTRTELREFTVEELVKMPPGEVCLLHKCKMGKCMIAMTEEFARLGKCPHCGEDLGVTIKEAMPKGYSSVDLNLNRQQLIGIKTAPVARRSIQKIIRTVGTIAHDPELYQAQVEFVQVIQAFERAKQSAVEEVVDQAQRSVGSTRIRLQRLGLSDELIDEIAARKEAELGLLFARPGEPVWVYAKLYEYDLSFVKIGQEVTAEIPSLAGQVFKGKVRSIDPMVDPMTRTTRMRAQLEDPEGLLKPDMYVNVTVSIDVGEVIAVPEEAVFSTGERNIVFVSKPDGIFEPRNVILGAKAEGFYEVRSGLNEGDVAVTSGNFLIDSESRLKGALEGMSGGEHQHGQ